MAHIIQRSLIIVQVSVCTCLYLDQAITCLKSTVPVYSSKRQWPNCMKCVWLSDGKWQYALFHLIYSEPWSLPLTTLCHYSFLFLSSPVPPLCSLILWSKLGIYVGASAKERVGVTTSVLVWLLEILRLSVFKPWFESVEDKYIFCFFRCRGSISIRAKTPIVIIYLSSVKDFHQKTLFAF